MERGETGLKTFILQAKQNSQPKEKINKRDIAEKFRTSLKAATSEAEMARASWVLEAEETLREAVLKLLIKYLGDVDNQLWSAAWLPFDQMVKVKQGQLKLAKALQDEIL